MDISYRVSLFLLAKMLPGCLIRAQFLGAMWQELLSVPEPGWLLFGLGWMGHTSPHLHCNCRAVLWKLFCCLIEDKEVHAYQDPLKAGVSPQSRRLGNPHCSIAAHREGRQSECGRAPKGVEAVVTSCGGNFCEPFPVNKVQLYMAEPSCPSSLCSILHGVATLWLFYPLSHGDRWRSDIMRVHCG